MSSSPPHRPVSDEPIDISAEDSKKAGTHTNGTSTGTGAGKTRGSGSGSGGRSTTTATRNPSSLASIAEENPEPYDYLARAVGPFEAQQAKLSELKKNLKHEMIDFLIMYHSWVTARFYFEKVRAAKNLEERVNDVTETEREQAAQRKQFINFAASIKSALLALNSFGV